jgi:hypothetical protein
MATSRIKDCFNAGSAARSALHQGVRVADFRYTSREDFDLTPYNEKELQSQRKIGANKVNPALENQLPISPINLKSFLFS